MYPLRFKKQLSGYFPGNGYNRFCRHKKKTLRAGRGILFI
ncbi:Hypothetical protein ACI5QL_04025 [Bacillus velezensis]|uniref:Uncharacterized protein n=1 Tax=Bacillus amyloliquefaciens (strain Y2) TaxID=1155777 RepID=I2CBU3_BACAY|nr:hypothetical protein MUS_4284 [Bacillus velezensis YAU B9601-Y2]